MGNDNNGGPTPGALKAPDAVAVTVAAIVPAFLLLLVVLFAPYQLEGLKAIILPTALGAGVLVALCRPRWVFYGFIVLCMTFPNQLEGFAISLGFMQIYPQDALMLYLAFLVFVRALQGKANLHSLRFNINMLLYFSLGIWAAFVGLFITGNPYDSVFGDFRRSFFYFLIYFFALLLTDDKRDVRLLKISLLAGSIAVLSRGMFHAFGGVFVTRRFGDAAHILNHFEITFSTFVIFYGLARISILGGYQLRWITLSLAGVIVVILGNFRTCWIGFAVGLTVLTLLLPRRQQIRLLVAASIAATAIIATLAVAWHLPVQENQSTIGENILQKADWRTTLYDTNVNWRWDSYQNAYQLWQTRPIIGRGLGEKLEFYTATSTGGSMLAIGHRVHNSYLWLLMSLGVTGFAVFVYVHWRFVVIAIRAVKSPELADHDKVTLTACLSFYSTIMASALFDVYLESSPPITLVSIIMALCLLTIRYQPDLQIRRYVTPA